MKTPVLTSQTINGMAGCEIFFKCENFQKVGAFKFRGATAAICNLTDKEKRDGVVTHSSGNHAQAIALAAQISGIVAHVVMPMNAPKIKVDAVKGYGANVYTCEPTIDARQQTADQIAKDSGATFIHPSNDLQVIAGQGTCAYEFIQEYPNIDSIITPVGGGGILAGTCLAVNELKKNISIFAGEPQGADDAYRSLKSGKIEYNTNPRTIADGLRTHLGSINFPIIRQHTKEIFLVTEEEILSAMRLIWERMKIIIEPSCAVPLAVLLANKTFFNDQRVGVILTGGNVHLDSFFAALALS